MDSLSALEADLNIIAIGEGGGGGLKKMKGTQFTVALT